MNEFDIYSLRQLAKHSEKDFKKWLKNLFTEVYNKDDTEAIAASVYTEEEKLDSNFLFEKYVDNLLNKNDFGFLWEFACAKMLEIKKFDILKLKMENDPDFDLKFQKNNKIDFAQCKASYISKNSLKKFKASGSSSNKGVSEDFKTAKETGTFYYLIFIGRTQEVGIYYTSIKEYKDLVKLIIDYNNDKSLIDKIKEKWYIKKEKKAANGYKVSLKKTHLSKATGSYILFTIDDLDNYFRNNIKSFLSQAKELKAEKKHFSKEQSQKETFKHTTSFVKYKKEMLDKPIEATPQQEKIIQIVYNSLLNKNHFSLTQDTGEEKTINQLNNKKNLTTKSNIQKSDAVKLRTTIANKVIEWLNSNTATVSDIKNNTNKTRINLINYVINNTTTPKGGKLNLSVNTDYFNY